MSTSKKALIVVTSHGVLGSTGKPTGYYLPEVSHPYQALSARGIAVDFASIRGGNAPVDPSSLNMSDPANQRLWQTPETRAQLEATRALADVDPAEYQAIFFAGGHGTMWDFRGDPQVQRLAASIYEAGGVVAAVCHGPAALVDIQLADGSYLVAGKQVAAFSNAEEAAAGLTAVVPFLLETELTARGAQYSKAPLWQKHVVVDQRLVTGQNPASASGVGEAMAALLAGPA